MKNILLIAGMSERYYFDPFVEACSGRDLKVFIFDPSRYPANASIALTLLPADEAPRGFLDVVTLTVEGWADVRLPIASIDVAWYLREGPQLKETATSLEARFAANESRAALHSMFSVLTCAWVNRRQTIDFLSSNKLYQQMVARKCGLSVPKTLLTNDPEAVQSFSDPREGLLLKAMGYMRLDENGEFHLYSQRFSHEELTAYPDAIRECPIFCQEYVPKRCEHRVMVIGDRVMSCRIDSQASEKTTVDWRHYDFENVEHTQVELPPAVQENLRQFMKAVDLRYGAIDLIETHTGDFVFLEVNPSGQWGWIADFAGLPIPNAVAHMLATL